MKNSLLRSTGGAVYVEFLLAFMPLFFMFLGMLQMGLLYGAGLVVRHSANIAARASIVVLDDDPQYYDHEARRRLETNASGLSSFAQTAGQIIGAFFPGGTDSPQWTGGARLQAIEFAAGMPLLPLSPSAQSLIRSVNEASVRGALGMSGLDSPEARVGWGLVYNAMAMRVTFPTASGGRDHHADFQGPSAVGDAGQIIARVTYLYNCQIPLANRLMCDDLFTMRTGVDPAAAGQLAQQFASGHMTLSQFQDAMNALQAHSDRRSRYEPRIAELGTSFNMLILASGLSSLAGGPVPRFVPLTAEASMPFQASNFRYHDSESRDQTGWAQEAD